MNDPCDECGEREGFDLYLGQWVCRQCKNEMMEAEYGWSK